MRGQPLASTMLVPADSVNSASSDDQNLTAMIVAGQRVGLDTLYARHASAVFARARRICRDPFMADEVTQDVFLQAWKDASRYDPARGSVKVWLLVIARTRALDRLRARRLQAGRSTSLSGAYPTLTGTERDSPGAIFGAREQRSLLKRLLAVLPLDDRQLIDLSFFKGYTHVEIAETLAQPLGTVKTRLRRVLKLLHSALAVRRAAPFLWTGWIDPPPAATEFLNQLRVVVVDDDPDTLRLLTLVLEAAGATVKPALSATEGLKQLASDWPDLLVTDLEMPGVDGFALLRRIRELDDRRGNELPVIAFTAHGAERDRERVKHAGFLLHLPKPVQPATLIARIAELFPRRRSSRSHGGPATHAENRPDNTTSAAPQPSLALEHAL